MNNITTLRNHLFDQLEKLKKASGENLTIEIERSKAIIAVSSEIISTAAVEAEIAKSLTELPSGFVPDVITHAVICHLATTPRVWH